MRIRLATFGLACLATVAGFGYWANSAITSEIQGSVVILTETGLSSLPFCEVEDASSGPVPCFWDGGNMVSGEAIGSFRVTAGENDSLVFTYKDCSVTYDRASNDETSRTCAPDRL